MATEQRSNPYPTVSHEPGEARKPVTLRTLQAMRERGEAFSCLAAYDATTARYLERAGVHVLLLGDSAAQVILGYDSTVRMPFELTVELTGALKRGAPTCHVMADMPFASYGISEEDTLRNAARLISEAHADSVKIEVGSDAAPLVERMSRIGIPVCAHVGLRPSHVGLSGAYRAAGRSARDALRVVTDAMALERAGAVLLLVEAVPPEVTRAIVERTSIPVIGIGAGPEAHGQILVLHDLVGLSPTPPRFAEPVAELGRGLGEAAQAWVRRVSQRDIGGQGYTMPPAEIDQFQAEVRQIS